jgi:hypothetical protein
MVLFALSPVSLMVSGYHGNTDPVMVMFLVWRLIVLCPGQAILPGFSLPECAGEDHSFVAFSVLFFSG